MRLKFKDLSKSNKCFYVSFGIATLAGLLYLIIDFNIWVFFLTLLFLLKMLDVKTEQRIMNLLDKYDKMVEEQAAKITDLCIELTLAEQKIKELETKKTTKKTTGKKVIEKKTTTKKSVKKEAKKDDKI